MTNYPNKQTPEAWATQLNFASLEQQNGLPAGILTNLVRQESGGDCSITSPAGAHGLCQFMPGTAAQLGVNSGDPVSSANGAAKYLAQLKDMFGGDMDKAIAAYNWGPGNMRRNVREHPNDWQNHLPAETRKYLAAVGHGVGPTYEQRQTNGTATDEDRERETTRRRAALRDAGAPDIGNLGDLLGQMFFALIKSFLEKKIGNIQGSGPDVVPPQSVSPADTLTPTPTPAPPGPNTTAASPTTPVRSSAALTR